MRVVLADDERKVRSALRLVLEQDPDFQVVGEAADAAGLLRTLGRKEADVLLLDWELPGLDPEQLVRLLSLGFPALKIIAMSTQPQVEQQAFGAGASGFLSKSDPPHQITGIIRALLL